MLCSILFGSLVKHRLDPIDIFPRRYRNRKWIAQDMAAGCDSRMVSGLALISTKPKLKSSSLHVQYQALVLCNKIRYLAFTLVRMH